jgi:hypothetical protein
MQSMTTHAKTTLCTTHCCAVRNVLNSRRVHFLALLAEFEATPTLSSTFSNSTQFWGVRLSSHPKETTTYVAALFCH